jgi:hypothetical protein
VKQATAKALELSGAEAKGDETGKVTALITYLRANLRGLFDDSVTEAERNALIRKMPKDRWRTASEVLKSGLATADEMNNVFAAMAAHAGLEARPALVADRTDLMFDPSLADRYFLRNVDMAVKHGEEWKLYDATTRLLPPGMVSWREEGMPALVSDPQKPHFIQSRFSPPEASVRDRLAQFTLDAEGTLSGKVVEVYSGHVAADMRGDLDYGAAHQHQEAVKERIAAAFSNAEVSDIQVAHVVETSNPLKIEYQVRIPGYAQRTGKRLLFAPFYFQRGETPLLDASERRYDIHFRYAWLENDLVRITLPEGFEFDNPEAPDGLNFGKPGQYSVRFGIEGRTLIAQRELRFGNEGMIVFPKQVYPQVKAAFDEVHRRDQHQLVLRSVQP